MKLEFETAVEQQREEETGEPDILEMRVGSNVKLDSEASAFWYHMDRPTPALFAVVMAGTTSGASDAEKSRALFEYFEGTLPEAEYRHLRNRFIRNKDIDLNRLLEVFEKSATFWGTFPTKPQSDSAGSRASIGPRSTGRAVGAGSTRSGSPSADS